MSNELEVFCTWDFWLV